MFRPFILAGTLVALNYYPAAAQQPTQAQRDAIRASCRSDFIANCSGVTPGGKEALECLLRNQAKLSPACNTAVSAVVPAAPAATPAQGPAAQAPAASAPTEAKGEQAPPAAAGASEPEPKSAAAQEAELKSVRQSCTLNDFMAHCSWIKPDNPELLLCLQANASDLSPACQSAIQGAPPPAAEAPSAEPERKATTTRTKKSTASRERTSPPPASAAQAVAPTPPTEAQKSAIRAACRSDFMANCSGVQPGGAEALQCLKSHAARLSGACQSAVAAIGGGAGGGGAPASAAASSSAAPGAATPTPAVAPLGPIPMMRPREALGILAMCRAEHETLCADAPLGGGRILTCLADHAQQLSPQCYQALARAAR
jgi:hypothetical protein